MPLSKPQRADERNALLSVRRIKSSIAPDASGHVNEADEANWEIFTKQWSDITPRGSREFFRGEQVAADITHQVEMLYNSESKQITTKHQIVMDGRRFNIAEPPRNVDEMNHSLRFACTEIK